MAAIIDIQNYNLLLSCLRHQFHLTLASPGSISLLPRPAVHSSTEVYSAHRNPFISYEYQCKARQLSLKLPPPVFHDRKIHLLVFHLSA